MRGKDCRSADNVQRIRITPAYAGKRQVRCRCPPERQDHPRLCGEKVQGVWQCLSIKGSPPPMRGKAKLAVESSACCRITPAYAGKSLLHRNNQDQNEDHPRLCGEKATMRRFSCTLSGSPPPMRGKVLLYVVLQIWDRITPAYAGKSSVRIILFCSW